MGSKGLERKVLIDSLIILISAGLLIFGIYWFSNDLKVATLEIVSLRSRIAQQSQGIESLVELRKMSGEAQIYSKQLDDILPPEDALLNYQTWLEGLAKIRQVKLEFSFSGQKVAPQANVAGSQAFILNLESNFDNIKKFLEDVESKSGKFVSSLDNINMTRLNPGIYRVSMQGKVFFK